MNPDDTKSEQETTASLIEVPSRWTALTSHDVPPSGAAWFNADPPVELLALPDDLFLQPKLAEILHWSLQRPPKPISEPAWDLIQQNDREEAPKAAPGENENGEKLPQPVGERHSVSPDRSLPGVKAVKNDIWSAIDRVKALKQKHELERAAYVKKRKEIKLKIEVKAAVTECTSCFEELPVPDVIKLPCNHSYCKPCLNTLIMTALQNEAAFPPKCCLTEIPPATVIAPLDSKQREFYKNKAAEYTIPANRRWYCPNTACTKWIPPTKLQRNRAGLQKCPHCSTKICSICRGIAHNNVDCPQDFGLEATLDIADLEGWKRCYSCRTMVERREGCRHITCKCGAEFCYVCGGRWRTCRCTEDDAINRRTVMRLQRAERDAAAQAEADEVALAIAAVERLTREDDERTRQRERQRELDRQQEEIELTRLEEIRLQEEEQRRHEEVLAEQQLRDILRLSLQEEGDAMIETLRRIFYHQHVAVDDRHGRAEQQLLQELEKTRKSQANTAEHLQKNIARNFEKRTERLKAKQESERQTLAALHQTEEDDVFLEVQLHLKGKPNQEAREKRLQDELKKQQASTRQQLDGKHESELEKLEKTARMEFEGIWRTIQSKEQVATNDHRRKLDRLCEVVTIQRTWFHTICNRRKEMVNQHNRIMVAEFEAGVETVGLTEDFAACIYTLPEKTQQEVPPTTCGSVQQSPAELEAPTSSAPIAIPPLLPMAVVGRAPSSNQMLPSGSSSSYETARGSPSSGKGLEESAMTWVVNSSSLCSTAATPVTATSRPFLSQLRPGSQVVTPPLLEKECSGSPMPQNGNAYLCTKNGEASKPVCFPPIAPPTPPESPFPRTPDIAEASTPTNLLSVRAGPALSIKQMYTAKTDLQLTIPQWHSGASSHETMPSPSAPGSARMLQSAGSPVESEYEKATKRKPVPATYKGLGSAYTNELGHWAASDSTKKEKSPIREYEAARTTSASGENTKVRKSRNPFRRRQFTDEEIQERMKKNIGDAFA